VERGGEREARELADQELVAFADPGEFDRPRFELSPPVHGARHLLEVRPELGQQIHGVPVRVLFEGVLHPFVPCLESGVERLGPRVPLEQSPRGPVPELDERGQLRQPQHQRARRALDHRLVVGSTQVPDHRLEHPRYGS
jgi:hypothetical protein